MTPLSIQDSLIADVPRLSPDEQRFFRALFDRCLIVGRRNYAPWKAAREDREMMRETSEELLDGCIYLAMDAVMRADERKQRKACESADRTWQALVGPDGFGVVMERTEMPEVSSSYDVVEGVVSEVLR